MPKFQVVSPYQMAGDQPAAVEALSAGVENGLTEQTLLGVTGSGKTFTMANIIERTQRPTLVLAHNKTLAAQLCSELREFFPHNYPPEAYIASTDTYIEKDSAINDEIDRLRHSATSALFERDDVIIVASVSCIYSLGDPIDYKNMVISLRPGMQKDRDEMLRKLIEIQYERNDIAFERNRFRVRGDVVEIWPAYAEHMAFRVEFFGDEIAARRGDPRRAARCHLSGQPLCHDQGKDGPRRAGDRAGAGRAGQMVRGAWETGRGPAHCAAHPL